MTSHAPNQQTSQTISQPPVAVHFSRSRSEEHLPSALEMSLANPIPINTLSIGCPSPRQAHVTFKDEADYRYIHNSPLASPVIKPRSCIPRNARSLETMHLNEKLGERSKMEKVFVDHVSNNHADTAGVILHCAEQNASEPNLTARTKFKLDNEGLFIETLSTTYRSGLFLIHFDTINWEKEILIKDIKKCLNICTEDMTCEMIANAFVKRVCKESKDTSISPELISLLDNSFRTLHYGLAFQNINHARNRKMAFPAVDSESAMNKVYTIVYLIIKNHLGVRCSKYGSSLFRSYLHPVDTADSCEPLYITLCINNKSHNDSWYSQLVSLLCTLSVMKSESGTKGYAELAFGKAGKFENVVIDVQSIEFRPQEKEIFCMINNLPVVISANQYSDMCFYTCIEEINQFVGHENLFKKIFLQVKKLVLENNRKIEWNVVARLDKFILASMLAFFCLQSPRDFDMEFQNAAKKFIQFISGFDWEQDILVPFPVSNSIEKSTFESQTYFNEVSLVADNRLINMVNLVMQYQQRYIFELATFEPSPELDLNILEFAVLDPLCFEQNMAENIDAKVLKSVVRFFIDTNVVELEMEPEPVVIESPLGHMIENLDYFALILFGIVSVPPLLRLIKEILFEKGPLPVGEVGKILQLHTNNANITFQMKELYGGLKKLLENHEDDFFIADDHPYNPKIFLRQLLSNDDYIDIAKGKDPTGYFKKLFPWNNTSNSSDTNSESNDIDGKKGKRRRNRKKKIDQLLPHNQPFNLHHMNINHMIQEQASLSSHSHTYSQHSQSAFYEDALDALNSSAFDVFGSYSLKGSRSMINLNSIARQHTFTPVEIIDNSYDDLYRDQRQKNYNLANDLKAKSQSAMDINMPPGFEVPTKISEKFHKKPIPENYFPQTNDTALTNSIFGKGFDGSSTSVSTLLYNERGEIIEEHENGNIHDNFF